MQPATATATASSSTVTSSQPQQQIKGNDMPLPLDEKKESPSADGYINSEVPMNSNAPFSVNGGMPPQQVYVNTTMIHHGMPALESQFHSLGMNEAAIMGHHHESEGNSGENDEEQPIKLFVGQVPKNLSEEDIFPTFDPFGPLKDVAIIRDKHSGMHRGCAFVTYWSSIDAVQAQDALHDKFTFPGARRPAQVKPAEPSVPENKLFIGMLSRKASEEEVRELFAPFGEIREIHMIRNADGTSKCAAFLRFMKRESALQAIENLHNNIVMDGSARPLIVKFADNKHQRQQRQMRNVRRQELLAAMGAGQAYPGYQVPPSVALPPHNAGQYPMPPPYGAPYPGGTPPHGHPHPHPPHPFMYPPHYGPSPQYGFQDRQGSRPPNPRPREGPAGANLFVYHLPHDLTDADLATAFNPFGNVISAKVYVDKYTGESKGFGFVSYDSVMSAESAIEQMNGFQIGNKRLKVQHKRVHAQNGIPQPTQQQGAPPHTAPSHPHDLQPSLAMINP
eukprot:scaffold350_cov133-Cylindrotheca_fusiformis.AAC.18